MPIASDDGRDDSTLPRHASGEHDAHRAAALDATPRRAGGATPQDHRTMASSIGWTVLGAVLPGAGLLRTRMRTLGIVLLALSVAALAALGWGATHEFGTLAGVAVRPSWLTALAVLTGALAVAMVVLITVTHLLTRPRHTTGRQRTLGAVVVGLLCFVITAPLAVATNLATSEARLINSLFRSSTSGRSQTRPTLASGPNPWAGKPRLNILLVGVDDTAARNYGTSNSENTDTIMVASIDTTTGSSVLVQLPRNLQYARFPNGSALQKAYPNGWGRDGDDEDSMLNQVWAQAPVQHPELFKNTDYPNADALKLAVQGTTGLAPDYFLALNIDGLQRLIDAVGGVTVNVNFPYAIGGDKLKGDSSVLGYLKVGANQHLDGYQAMWYARSRYNDPRGDFGRMARQSCLIKALGQQVTPTNLLLNFQDVMAAGSSMVRTDIPQSDLPAMVQLGTLMRDQDIKRLQFVSGQDGFVSADPDIAKIQQRVAAAIATATPSPTASASRTGAQTATATAPATSTSPTPTTSASSGEATATGTASTSPSGSASADTSDPCAYHPIQDTTQG